MISKIEIRRPRCYYPMYMEQSFLHAIVSCCRTMMIILPLHCRFAHEAVFVTIDINTNKLGDDVLHITNNLVNIMTISCLIRYVLLNKALEYTLPLLCDINELLIISELNILKVINLLRY